MVLDQIIDDFSLLESWEDKYRYLIEMGNALPALDKKEQIAANKVSGCVSQVWLVVEPAGGDRLVFRGMSDAHIVRGLIVLLLQIYSGKSPQAILAEGGEDIFKKLGLEEHLSPQRSSGFYAMVRRIKSDAQAALVSA